MSSWTWEIAEDPGEVHQFLCRSDAYHATAQAPAPRRLQETSELHVRNRSTHLLRQGGTPVAMFTLTQEPRFVIEAIAFLPAQKPIYLSRLAVGSACFMGGSMVGAQALRRAMEVARESGADAIRSEANPDLARSYALLEMFGFKVCNMEPLSGQLRRAHLQLDLA